MDKYFMKRAISLAKGGQGKVSPNPLVGAVIVKNERIISEGFHSAYGEKHAEVVAIESSCEDTTGTTLYCNLEPCSQSYPGKINPPCCDAIIKAKISRVVIGQIDPNPKVAGSGVNRLRSMGIEVTVGILERESMELNKGFNSVMINSRPYVHIKWAQTLDGQIATTGGVSKWISSEACREETHSYRSKCDAILVGRKTLELDNPTLDARYGFSPSPRPIVIDPLLKASPNLNIFSRNPIIICSKNTLESQRAKYRGNIITFEGRFFRVTDILETLKGFGINSIFLEGGSTLITHFIEAGAWDRMTIYTAPKILGQGLSPIGDLGVKHPRDSVEFGDSEFKILDNHMVFNGYREERLLCSQE